MRGAGAIAALLIAVAAPANAQGIVISARGPDAAAFPPGKTITIGQRIALRAGSVISALSNAGTYVFRGPGRFAFGAPSKRIAFDSLYAKALIDPRRKTRILARTAAVRNSERAGQRDWRSIDVASPGRFCIAPDAVPRLWRADSSAPLKVDVTNGSEAKPVRVEFATGAFEVAWPTDLGPRPAKTIVIARSDTDRIEIESVTLAQRAATTSELAAQLIASGCGAQAEILVTQLEAQAGMATTGQE